MLQGSRLKHAKNAGEFLIAPDGTAVAKPKATNTVATEQTLT
jgi:hypothetical protein